MEGSVVLWGLVATKLRQTYDPICWFLHTVQHNKHISSSYSEVMLFPGVVRRNLLDPLFSFYMTSFMSCLSLYICLLFIFLSLSSSSSSCIPGLPFSLSLSFSFSLTHRSLCLVYEHFYPVPFILFPICHFITIFISLILLFPFFPLPFLPISTFICIRFCTSFCVSI